MPTSTTNVAAGNAATGATTAQPITNPLDFADALLTAIGAPVNQTNEALIMAWQQSEGQWTAGGAFNAAQQHNPLNIESTPTGAPTGKTITDSAGNSTLAFGSWADGILATAAFMKTNDPQVVMALQRTDPTGFFSNVGHWNPGGGTSYIQGIMQNYANLAAANLHGNSIPIIGGAISAAESTASSVSSLISIVSSAAWWKRVGIFSIGAVLILGGVVLFVATSDTGKKVAGDAVDAAAIVGG